MRLQVLLKTLPAVEESEKTEGVEITGVADDSRKVKAGDLFVAVKGEHADGHNHIDEAIRRGAVAVIMEKKLKVPSATVRVPDTVDALARVSAAFWGYPSETLTTVGITGTNGKTTVSLLLQNIFRAAGIMSGLIGTIRYEIGGEILPAPNTTPQSLQVQQLLYRMKAAGMKAAVMEVSSHALELGRVLGCRFDASVFTNLSRDHLDFHLSMEEYYRAKKRLFGNEFVKPGGVFLINIDDPWGRRLADETSGKVRTYAINEKADFQALDPHNTISGVTFTVRTPTGRLPVKSSLSGTYNIYNILSAVAAAQVLGLQEAAVIEGIASLTAVPGRFEKIVGPGFTAIVDYAHTDDALRNLLQAVREVCPARVITIFGCGGDRDRGKRPLMGRVAAELSDRVIVTSDNPRTEEPARIIEEILAGIGPELSGRVEAEEDRRLAIERGIGSARQGDVVVVAGKGHEDYQIIGEKKIHFDDREEVRKAIAQNAS